jgi:hypothetical protein
MSEPYASLREARRSSEREIDKALVDGNYAFHLHAGIALKDAQQTFDREAQELLTAGVRGEWYLCRLSDIAEQIKCRHRIPRDAEEVPMERIQAVAKIQPHLDALLEERRGYWQQQMDFPLAQIPVAARSIEQTPVAPQPADRRPGPDPSPEDLMAQRGEQLGEAWGRWGRVPFSWIHAAAGVDHKDAYNWKNGKLPDSSAASDRMNGVLNRPEPPAKPSAQN